MTDRNRALFYGLGFGLGLGATAGAVGGYLLARQRAADRRAPDLDAWQRVLAKEWGEVDAAMFAAQVQVRYEDLYAQRPRFAHRTLRMHLEDCILPGLALYRTLREDNLDQAAALAVVETLFQADQQAERRLLERLGRLPTFFPWFRAITRQIMRRDLPPEGWETEWVEDSADCLAFTIHRCFYLDVLTAYGAPELTPLYCRNDDLLYENVSPYLRWQRTKTLGRLDDCCDFRFTRVTPTIRR